MGVANKDILHLTVRGRQEKVTTHAAPPPWYLHSKREGAKNGVFCLYFPGGFRSPFWGLPARLSYSQRGRLGRQKWPRMPHPLPGICTQKKGRRQKRSFLFIFPRGLGPRFGGCQLGYPTAKGAGSAGKSGHACRTPSLVFALKKREGPKKGVFCLFFLGV